MPVVNLKDPMPDSGWVLIDRRTRWGNPFVIPRDGDRAQVIERYRRWLWTQIRDGKITAEDLAALHGKHLACHCAPLACHGDVLETAAKWAHGRVTRRITLVG